MGAIAPKRGKVLRDGQWVLPLICHHTVPERKFLIHGQVTIIFVVSVCLFVCAEFFSAVFDPISIKLGHMLYVLCPLEYRGCATPGG